MPRPCFKPQTLIISPVSWPLRVFLLVLACVLNASAKDIRLRKELIQTPAKPAPAARSQIAEAPADGLFIVQLEGPITDAQRQQLIPLQVELIQPIPEDAFVARLNGTSLSALRAVPFVRWVGVMKPGYKLHQKLEGLREKKTITWLVAPNARPVEIAALRRTVPGSLAGLKTSSGTILRGMVDANQLNALANSPAVLWIEPGPAPKLVDEIATEIVAGEADGPRAFVHELGFDGTGVAVAVADTGLMWGTPLNMHPDLAGRADAFFYYGNLSDAADEHSHGTHVAGIIAGNGATGETDESGYLYGLGVAPGAHIVAQRIFDAVGNFESPAGFEEMTRNAVQAGAVIGSNSWVDDTQGAYDLSAMQFDALVRDADAQTPGDQPYILEFSAGNAGPGERTIGSPAVAKNVIATGASENNRFDFFIYDNGQETMADFSSRGPCEDGRIKPDLVAPGTWIASLQSAAATDESAWLPISANYQYQGGTSQSGPQVSGAAAVFVQYYRETHGGQTPSPALVKAALINSAVDMDPFFGTTFVPNNDEGWGRVDLTELIGSDRKYQFVDQTTPLVQEQVYETEVFVFDFEQPFRVTLTYTDAPGSPLSIPALVNDLDLEVIAPDGTLYAGNQFIDGESATEPVGRDALNNVECVYLRLPIPGEYHIRVRARNVPQDVRHDTLATDQDFALVISGSLPEVGHAALILDRPAYTAPAAIGIKLIDFDLAGSPSATVSVTSSTETSALVVQLLASGSAGVFTGRVNTAQGPATADAVLQIKHGDQIQARYQDALPSETVTATRRADLLPPLITGIISTNRFGNEMVIWTTDEPATSIVRYGTDGVMNMAVTNTVARLQHSLILTNLVAGKIYNFTVISADEAGNVATQDNGGSGYTFDAKPAATVLLVDAYVPVEDSTVIPITEYTAPLDATGVSYEVWSLASNGQPKLMDLLPFKVVIWRFNHSCLDFNSTLSLAQQTTLTDYIKHDGSLLIASMELLSRIGDVPFRTNILQVAQFELQPLFHDCTDCDEDHGVTLLRGAPGDSVGAGVQVTLDYSNYPTFDLFEVGPDVSDVFMPTPDAVSIFVDHNSGRTTGIRWPRDLRRPGRVIFLGFPLDAIPMEGPALNNRVSILRNLLSFLAPGVNGLGALTLDRNAYSVPSQIRIELADSDLAGQGLAPVKLRSDTDPEGVDIEMVETGRRGVFQGYIRLIDAAATPGVDELRAADGDRLWAEYFDASANNSLIQARAQVDTIAPMIYGTEHTWDYQFATVTWETDEATDSLIQFGESTFLSRTAYAFPLTTDHSLVIPDLQPDRLYYYQVVSRDAAGNTVTDDNNGQLYTFRTLTPKLLPWIDDFEGANSDWTVESTEISELAWEHGVPSNGLQSAGHSGSQAWGSNLHGGDGEYAETFLTSPGFFLTGGNRATLKFWNSYDFTASSDVESASLYLTWGENAVLLGEYDGLAASWEEEEIDLTPYIGKVVQLVFFHQMYDFQSSGETHLGWLIDDISVSMSTVEEGTIKVGSNLSQAGFTIDGPSAATGQGTGYTNTAAVAGTYTVTFANVPYYKPIPPQTKVLPANGTISFDGNYEFNDANGNLISDEWETEYFGAAGANDGQGDADHDGLNDYREFIAGTSPQDAGSVLHFDAATPLSDGRFQLSWPTVPGRSYRVMGSTDAQTWTEYAPWARADSDHLTHTLPPLSGAGHFFQIEVKP